MKKFSILIGLALLTAGCTSSPSTPNAREPETGSREEGSIVVATSFYPLTHFVEQVGGDLVEVEQVAAPGSDPHSFAPNPGQIQQIFESDVFLYNGEGQDPYADRIHEELEGKDVRVLIATKLVERMSYEHEQHEDGHHDDESYDEHDEHGDHDDHEEEHHDEDDHDDHDDEDGDHDGHDNHDDHGHNHGEWDPHVWLDPQRVEGIVQEIAAVFSDIQPANASVFQANADAYILQLRTLDADMKDGLSNCALDAVIVSHDAYRYLANRYGFHTLEIAGLSPSIEPSPARLAELADIAKDEGIGHVFFETQVSPALSETLASEIGAETLVLHSIETLTKQERSAGMTYIDLQRMNLTNLRSALQCS